MRPATRPTDLEALTREAELSDEYFAEASAAQDAQNSASFGGSDASSWLLSILMSLLTSLLLWQPLMVYVVTWVKVWLFTWNLKMKLGPSNVLALCRRCSCGLPQTDAESDVQLADDGWMSRWMDTRATDSHSAGRKRTDTLVVAHGNRPFDVISFLGSSWIIDDTKPTPTTPLEDASAKVELSEII